MEIRTEIPEAAATDPDLSDADSTLEYVPRSHSEPVIRTMEVTEADIVEVQAAVAALEREETEKTILPPAVLPPKRAVSAAAKKNDSRKWLLVAAALGTWAFFVSLASLAAFGVHAVLHGHADHAAVATLAAPVTPPQVAPKRARFIAEPVPPRAHLFTADDSPLASEPRSSGSSRSISDEETNRSTSRFGILRFAHATNGALVDGEPRRVTGDALFLSCGAHRIRTSQSGSRTVRVPCGKTVTL